MTGKTPSKAKDTGEDTGKAPAPGGRERLFLIDSMSYIFRAYHALPRLTNKAGLSTHAVYGFNNMIKKLLDTYHPEYVGAAFDLAGPTFRHESFADYKANREEMPEDLGEQIPYVRQLLEAMRIPVLSHPGFEADDVIGTLARQAAAHDIDVFIVSGDKDMMQLVGDHVSVLNPMKDDLVSDPAKVAEVLGVEPQKVTDLMALMGDAVDNIPGAPGIGPKGAKELIQKYGSVEACLDRANEVANKRYREALLNHRDQILLSKQLATIHTDAPVKLSLDEVRSVAPDREKLMAIYQEMEFSTLLRSLLPEGESASKDYAEFQNEEEVAKLLASLKPDQVVAIAVSKEDDSAPMLAGMQVGMSTQSGQGRVAPTELLGALKQWLENAEAPKAAHDAKAAMLALGKRGIALAGVLHDTLLYSFLLDANEGDHDLSKVVERQFSVKLSDSAAEEADLAGRLVSVFLTDIHEKELERLYREIELPLVPILAEMERQGIKLNPEPLAKLSARLEKEIDALCKDIYRLTGSEFNINSPKQLSEVLFEKLGLQSTRRGKKATSTAIDVLEELAEQHEAPRKVVEYRQLTKLKSTYIDTLPKLIDPVTGRLHTHYNQAGAATGRLSSINPNLQNIPIRTELGREIRAAFVAKPGHALLGADYSQIELRLLAHLSEDPMLVEAFRRGDDIHELTASAVFDVEPANQTAEHRRRAKAVNYGIVYGLSAFGLSQQLGIGQAEAQTFIDRFFERYRGVHDFIERTLEEVRRTSEVRTFCGRLRRIPDIQNKNFALRQFAERIAVNTPLQGGAADLIKLAMLGVDGALREKKLSGRMLLQVHDELILEVPEAEVSTVARLVRERMENAYSFRVPIVAEVAAGPNWRDMEVLRV